MALKYYFSPNFIAKTSYRFRESLFHDLKADGSEIYFDMNQYLKARSSDDTLIEVDIKDKIDDLGIAITDEIKELLND